MTLSIGLNAALSGLSATADQTAVVSRNVARAGDPHASRKTANLITLPGGGVKIASITRTSDAALFNKMLSATSDAGTQQAILDALNQLDQTVNDPELDSSPAALVSKLTEALQNYATSPQDSVTARTAVAAAGDLVQGLHDATNTVQQMRASADADMASSVDRINTLLSQFETVNREIVGGTRRGDDVTDQLDQRDQILASLSEEIGIRTVRRTDDDMAIYTDSGLTLFDGTARSVTFDRTLNYAPATAGNAVYVDGVPVTGSQGPMVTKTGRLAGLAAVRDNVAVTYQSQLDEVARGLIGTFAESDQSATPTLPDVPGLFTYPGAPAMPASGAILTGLAGSIIVNPNADPTQGGDPSLLRDGGMSGNPAYIYNTGGGTAFSDRLQQLLDGLNTQQPFDPAAQGAPSATLAGFASSSAAWLQEMRKNTTADADYKNALLQRSSEALSNATGVNLDEEMTLLLELERSYQASTRLITTIDNMLGSLLQAAG
jgi:flagellar hook-associated protein 1 FlgK